MEAEADVMIVGAGISGLATSLGLHRLGIGSFVLESSDSLRTTGFAFARWINAWKALNALGLANSLRQHHVTLDGNVTSSRITGLQTFEMSFKAKGKQFSSKVVSVDESGYFKLVHLADGTILKVKSLSEGQDALAPATYPTSLERRALRKAGFTEQRLPPSLGSGRITESNGKIMNFFGDKCLSLILAGLLLKKADFDCGKLSIS
ncbi:unnamed protein product [Prunus armeniaca]|uniref:FAD-binding domain-containing protein n=1 Tax=Prunus armeniaca TaxID=36596 RepID=A0A6J5WI94_PRUAR|nr:unnamed protein product [Prunus armeniaca]